MYPVYRKPLSTQHCVDVPGNFVLFWESLMGLHRLLCTQTQMFLRLCLWEHGASYARFNQATHIRRDVRNCTGLDETHISQIKDCRWNGCTFHASSCCIWMDAETSLTKMYPVSICERQMVVKVCSWAKPEQTVVCFCPNLTSKIRTGSNLLAGCPPLFYVHMH